MHSPDLEDRDPPTENARTALILLGFYWGLAAVVAVLVPSPGGLDLGWPVTAYFFALPTTLLLSLLFALARWNPGTLVERKFMGCGLALPLVYVVVVWGTGTAARRYAEHRLEAQISAATVVSFVDEPMQTPSGILGIRLRYRVSYPLGLSLPPTRAAFAQLGLPERLTGFVALRHTVTPQVMGTFDPGTYEIAEDIVPVFVPFRLASAAVGRPPRQEEARAARNADGEPPCFRWGAGITRDAAFRTPPQRFQIVLHVGRLPTTSMTSGRYALSDFVETAKTLGAVDCAPGRR
jgi:hypothetical protein